MAIIVKTGRGNRVFKSDTTQLSQFIAADALDRLKNLAFLDAQGAMFAVAARIQKVANGSLSKVLPGITRSLLGLRSPKGAGATLQISPGVMERGAGPESAFLNVERTYDGGTFGGKGYQFKDAEHRRRFPSGTLSWKALSGRTLRKKAANNPANADKFFVDSGELKSFLRSAGDLLVSGTGGVRAEVQKKSTFKKTAPSLTGTPARDVVGNLRIVVMSKVGPNVLPGLKSGNWADFNPNVEFERRMGIPAGLVRKLQGLGEHNHRPLIQPAVQFWTLFKLPSLISGAIVQELKTSNTRARKKLVRAGEQGKLEDRA